jgi:hypothetical protein
LGSLIDCYSTGAAHGDGWVSVGGLVGSNSNGGTVDRCYCTGSVSNTPWEAGSQPPIGGLVGGNYGHIGSSFWDIETSGQTSSASGMGVTTDEMKTASTFLDAGWDFVGETANGTEDIWWIDEGKGYPRLYWEIVGE